MNGKCYMICLAAALAMLGAAIVPAGMNATPLGVAYSHDVSSNDSDHNETSDNDTGEASGPAIGGGGWFMVTVGNVSYKDTFGMGISGNTSVGSAFVLQGRDQSVRVHSLNFTQITFSSNNTTVNAKGWCTVNGAAGYWFNLTAMDGGNRSSDMLALAVYKDVNHTGDMNETTPTYQWVAMGLGGGHISISPGNEDHEDADDNDSGGPKGDKPESKAIFVKEHGRPNRMPFLM